MRWAMVAAVAVALFVAGRRMHHAHGAPTGGQTIDPPAVTRATAPPAPGSSAARRAAMQVLLTRVSRSPAPAPLVALPSPTIEQSVVEPPAITAKRRERASAEIDERAPGLSASKRTVLLDEADRLAWDKRQLRAAFLAGKLSEADYVAALKDDIRAALADFVETLSEDEYVALFNRRPGSDPFTLESLVGRPADKQLAP